jgi:broad specificity phosphatase PhoE
MTLKTLAAPVALDSLRIRDRYVHRNFASLLSSFFPVDRARNCVIIVSHSGTISNMLLSHTEGEKGREMLKPRNSSVITVDDAGQLMMLHEGTLPTIKYDECHEYFKAGQFHQFAYGSPFGWCAPAGCLLLLVRHGIAVSNVDKTCDDGRLTKEGEVGAALAAVRICEVLQQEGVRHVRIFSSNMQRTRHTAELLHMQLRRHFSPAPLPRRRLSSFTAHTPSPSLLSFPTEDPLSETILMREAMSLASFKVKKKPQSEKALVTTGSVAQHVPLEVGLCC